jgi:hypothetical protein
MEMLCSRCDYDASNDVLNLREDSWQCPDCKRWNLTRADRPEKQVGGNHYNMPIEPIEFTEANELTFHEGNAIKYISRHRRKDGRRDIEKAIWYLKRILETEYE